MATSLTTAPPELETSPPPQPRRLAPEQKQRKPITMAWAIAWALVAISALTASFAAFLFFGSAVQQTREQSVMYNQLRTDLAQAVVPVSGIIAPGTPLGVVDIPRIGVQQVFVEGSASQQTVLGPGLSLDSVLPGQAGRSVLVGRRTTFGAPFLHLDELRTGDSIIVTTGQGRFVYTVDVVRTSDAPPTQIKEVPARLSLVTSDPAITPSRNLVVSAQLNGTPQQAATGTFAPESNQPGQGSKADLVDLLLWSQLLLVVTVAVTWAALKFNARAIWIGATPVLLAIIWNVFENLALLLPNTL